MNLSGKAVRYWMNELKIQPENLLVISDDLNIPFGTLRLRKNGSAGGHNGLTNITELIGTQEYARIRVGIGNDFGRGQQVGYVLGELSPEEKKEMEQISKRVIDGVKAWATIGPDRAMNTVNTKPKTIASEGETQAK
jgi:PTH1 family peptidyl-tRNA hydrolase